MKIVSKPFYIFLSLPPIVSLLLFYSFLLQVYFTLGRVPTQINNPDPGTFGLHFQLAELGLIFPICTFFPWIVVTILSWYKKSFSKKFLILIIIFYILSCIWWLIVFRLYPHNSVKWFFD